MDIPKNMDQTMSESAGPEVFQERRRANRIQEAVALRITRLLDQPAAGDQPVSETLGSLNNDAPTHKVSLSSVGLAFAHDILMHPGELITVDITLFPARHTARVDGRIVSANDAPEIADGDKPTYRIAFESISDEDRDFIESHVAGLLRKRPESD